jgi:RNA polymerase sigma factor (sigma-70 family)
VTSPRELLLANLDVLGELVRSQARRYGLSDEDRDELESYVRLRLLDNDYSILRRFEGRSSLRTYLTVVVQRLFVDFGNRNWGKWRPSAAARQMGPLAEALESLLYRRGLTFDEACQVLSGDPAWGKLNRRDLSALAQQLAPRTWGRPAPKGEPKGEPPDRAPDPEQNAVQRAMAASVGGALGVAFRRQKARDRLILRLRYVEGLSVAEIARTLSLPHKSLYKRIDVLLDHLRRDLRAAGVDDGDVAALLSSSPELDLPSDPLWETSDPLREIGPARPSIGKDDDADGQDVR